MHSNLILTLGGIGKRFSDEGFSDPKFLLKYNKRTVLECIMEKYDRNLRVLIILNKIYSKYRKVIEEILVNLDFKNFKILLIIQTKSQAETAYKGIFYLEKKLMDNNPIFIINGDTITEKKNISELSSILKNNNNMHGVIEYFISLSKNFSYVKINKFKIVQKIEEKKLISKYATSGFYGFKNASIYISSYRLAKKKYANSLSELYISFIYKEMIMNGKNILAIKSKKKPIVLGTPLEYLNA